MPANYPGSVPSFTNKSAGQTIGSAHINDLQNEVVAIGTGLLLGTAPLASSITQVASLGVTGGSSLAGAVYFASVLTPIGLSSGDTANYAPAGSTAAFAMRLAPSAGGSTLSGLSNPVAGQLKLLLNVGAVALGIKHDGAGSSAGVRFVTRTQTDTSIGVNGAMLIWYDSIVAYWRQIS